MSEVKPRASHRAKLIEPKQWSAMFNRMVVTANDHRERVAGPLDLIDVPVYGAHICPTCLGYGVVSGGYPLGHPNYGKLSPCPEPGCPVIREHQQKRAEALAKKHECYFDESYSRYTFESWGQIPEAHLKGKQAAAMFASYMVDNNARPFWATDVLQAFKVDYKPAQRQTGPNLALPENRPAAVQFEIGGGVYTQPNSYGSWLVLSGDYGTGKTGLAMAVHNALRAAGFYVLYIRLPDLIRDIQRTYGYPNTVEGRSQAQEDLDRLTLPLIEADVLVVDEANVQTDGYGQASQDKEGLFMDYIIGPRHAAGADKPVIMTTNLAQYMTAEQRSQARRVGLDVDFAYHWRNRIATRVFERAHWLTLAGPRLRHYNAPSVAL
jgi:hypothetical protein